MTKYVVLKLINKTDIIGKKITSRSKTAGDKIKLQDALTVMTSTLDNGSTIVYLRPFDLLSKSNAVDIPLHHVICEYEPESVFIDYYHTMISYNEKVVNVDITAGMKSANILLKAMMNKEMEFNPEDLEKNREEQTITTTKPKFH
jgi:hypothetical protein